ncbi:Copper amine oxidase N-terminal domain-containing protein [Paenibacillus uliginis N3/975]|uniref:Copper amine oxidase N-terminal domain-containing protein n=1 Tax=Paenibacillus uliginis N3/975 TaxID=1313296 RepID=A0A1X7HBB1_9BACL|nr:phosphodiester glycosidase family protein [Paenibacillus uliginis]SMF83238.1 Copper amine oxidase N-terminal domain-containing protein [Paenibacillus uliginis N3/975]
MKRITALVLLAMLTLVTPLYAASPAKMLVYVDKSSQSFIPVGLLKSYEGIKVNYQSAQKKIDISMEDTNLTLYVGKRTAYVNGKKTEIKAAPFRDNGNTFVPLQFISQHLNLNISWNKDTSSVQISQGETTTPLPVLSGTLIPSSSKPIVSSRKSFKVGSRTFSAQTVTVSLLHPKVELGVVLAGNKVGKVEDLRSLAKRNNAVTAINGTFFDAYSPGSYRTPYGYIVGGGNLLKDSPADRRTVFTFDSNNLAQLLPGLDFKEHFTSGKSAGAVQAGPRLVVNGKVSLDVKKEGFRDPKILTGGGARSALGITKDHKLILLTTGGATIPQLAEIMKQAGAYQAMNLDGGASSGLYYNGSYLTSPGRQISNAIIVKYK